MSVQSTHSIAGGATAASGFATSQSSPRQTSSTELDLPGIEVKPKKDVSPDYLQKAIDEANEMFRQIHSDIKFVIDEESKKVVIKLIEPSSGEVINQYPSEQVVAISNAIKQAQMKAAEQHVAFTSGNAGLLGMFVKHKS